MRETTNERVVSDDGTFQCAMVKVCKHSVVDPCACGFIFGSHGAPHPHTRPGCGGFSDKVKP